MGGGNADTREILANYIDESYVQLGTDCCKRDEIKDHHLCLA